MRTKRRNRERRKTESEKQQPKPKARLRTQMHKHPEHQVSQRHPQSDPPVQRIPLMPKAKGKEDPSRVMGRPQASHLHQAKMPQKGLHLPRPQRGQRHHACSGQSTCNCGSNCPFAHDSSLAPKATSKTPGTVSTTAAAATVAAVLPSASAHAVEPKAFGTGQSLPARSGLRGFFRCFAGRFSVLSSAVPAVLPFERSRALPGMQSGPFHVDWIADSGAGRNLTSIKALLQQGFPVTSSSMSHNLKIRIAVFACNHACMPVGSADIAMSLSLLGEIFLQPRPSERELQQTSLLSRKPQVMIRRPLWPLC